ncbi:MAG TPA: cytidine deaminase [Terriglobia bacterium]|nr:cytidine deaminase [Terriglobia bacterium]
MRRAASREKSLVSTGELSKLVPALGAASQARLLRTLNDASLRGEVPASEVEAILAAEHKAPGELMSELLPVAQLYARPPISHYRVGAVVRGVSGSLYWGANLEVPGEMLGFSVHGEQSAVANAYLHEERGLTALAVTAAPCGHCRQFLNELAHAAELEVVIQGNAPARLGSLLPSSFGPDNLGVHERLFENPPVDLEPLQPATDELALAAVHAASRSYAPYTKAYSGIAIRSAKGAVYPGSYLENVAFNPSLSPLQSALVGLIMAREQFADIADVVLAEVESALISQMSATRAVLGGIAPHARLERVAVRCCNATR